MRIKKSGNQGITPDRARQMMLMREYRLRNGLTQEDMARKMGMRQQVYSNAETGRSGVRYEFVKKFREITGIDLFSDKVAPPLELPKTGDKKDPVLEKQITMLQDLVDTQRKLIAQMEREHERCMESKKGD